jgi:acyl-CoA synthetase (AMP-forming)/AMP-acid ligase II
MHCEQNLAKYKRPLSIDIVDARPKTTVNKTDKNALREQVRRDYPG